MIPEEQAQIIEIIEDKLRHYSYHVSDECIEAMAQEIWDTFGCNIMNGYA